MVKRASHSDYNFAAIRKILISFNTFIPLGELNWLRIFVRNFLIIKYPEIQFYEGIC